VGKWVHHTRDVVVAYNISVCHGCDGSQKPLDPPNVTVAWRYDVLHGCGLPWHTTYLYAADKMGHGMPV
jgi:hypothetical protein